MVFYFTGTGNCLYVAKQFSDHPISIPQELKKAKLEYTADSIGIVVPTYLAEAPKLVMEFLKRAKFHTDYLYVILTYGNEDGDVAMWFAEQCAKLGHRVEYVQTMLMVDNYIPVFDMDQQRAMDKKIPEQLAAIQADVAAKKRWVKEVDKRHRDMHKMVPVMRIFAGPMLDGRHIQATDACIGCGICAKVCPTANIVIKNGKPSRVKKSCVGCLACVHNCPQKALTQKNGDRNPNARYRHEEITLEEIIRANQQ